MGFQGNSTCYARPGRTRTSIAATPLFSAELTDAADPIADLSAAETRQAHVSGHFQNEVVREFFEKVGVQRDWDVAARAFQPPLEGRFIKTGAILERFDAMRESPLRSFTADS